MVMVSDFEEDTFPCYSIHFRCGKPVVAKVVKELTDKTFPYHEKKINLFFGKLCYAFDGFSVCLCFLW